MKTIFIIAKTKYTLKYERKMPEKEVLKKIEEEWIENNFKISNGRIKEIIRSNSN